MHHGRKLDNVAVLHGLSLDRLKGLAAECQWRVIDQGATILDTETDSTEVFFLTEGRARITIYSPTGREVAFRDLDLGASFGELAAIDGLPRSVSVVALEKSVVAIISAKQFWKLLLSDQLIAGNVLRRLAALIRDLTSRVVDTTTLTAPERVRGEVVRQARAASIINNSAIIKGFPTHADLANQIGATREAVSRELSRMSADGLIRRKGRDLLVMDFKALVATLG